MSMVELCPGSSLGSGFQLYIGLAEIHVPRMWVEQSDSAGPEVNLTLNEVVTHSLCCCSTGLYAYVLS